MCILVPAHRRLYGSLDAKYRHERRYSRRDLESLMRAGGLEVVRSRYFNPVGAVGWFVAGRILRVPRISPLTLTLSERVAVPVGRALARLGPPPFGQSVIGVGRRGRTG